MLRQKRTGKNRPSLSWRAAEAGQTTKDAFETWRLVHAGNTVVLQPTIIRLQA